MKLVLKFLCDTLLVFFSQFLEIRFLWFWSVVMSSFIPLTLVGFLLLFGERWEEKSVYILTGSITYAVALQAGLSLGQKIGRLKIRRVFDYYASLPISKLSFVCGLYLEALILSAPSYLTLLVISLIVFRLHIVNPFSLFMAFTLGGFSLAGVGSLIGFYSRSGQIASIATQVLTPILVFFAPVYIPEAKMPAFLYYTSRILPTTYVARLLRDAFGVGGSDHFSVLVLVGFVIFSLTLVHYGLDWRGERSQL